MVANKDESLEVQNAEDTTKVDTIGEEVANSEQQSTSLEQKNNDYSYEAGAQQINNMYNQSAEAIQAEYEQQWQKQRDEYQNTRDDVGKTYWEQQNDLANQYNVARRNMAMNDVANGLNTGTFYNRQESLSNVYYNNNAQLETAKSEQIAELDKAMADLDSEYQRQVNEALANNELERAQKLYDEWNSGYTKAMEKAQILGNYGDFSGYKDLGYSDEEIAAMVEDYNSSKEEVEAEKALERAQTLATYGDFSGYLRAGYTLEEVQKMQNAWIMANSQVAYMSGMITEDTYKAIIDGTLNGKFNVQGSYDLNAIAKEIKQEQQVNTVVADVVNNSSELLTPVAHDDTYGSSSLSAEEKRKIMENVGLLDYTSIIDYTQYWKTNTEDTTNSRNLPTSVSSDSLAGQIQRDNIGARTADTTQAYRDRYAYNLAQNYTPNRISSNTNTTLPSAQAAQNASITQQAKNIREELSGTTVQKPLTTTNTAYNNASNVARAEAQRKQEEADAEEAAYLSYVYGNHGSEYKADDNSIHTQQIKDSEGKDKVRPIHGIFTPAKSDAKPDDQVAKEIDRYDYWENVIDRDSNIIEPHSGTPYGSFFPANKAYRATGFSNTVMEKQQKNRDMASQAIVTHGATEEQIDRDLGVTITASEREKAQAEEERAQAEAKAQKKAEQAREDYWNGVMQRDQLANNGMAQSGTPYGSYNATEVTFTPQEEAIIAQEEQYIAAEEARAQFAAETQANFDRLNAANNWYVQNGYRQTPPENVSDDEVAVVYDAVTGAGFVSASSYRTDVNDYQIQDYNYGNGYSNQVVETFGPQYLFNNPNVSNPYAYSLPIAIGKGLSLGKNLVSGKTAYYLPQISQEDIDSANALMEETYNNFVASNNTNGGGSW